MKFVFAKENPKFKIALMRIFGILTVFIFCFSARAQSNVITGNISSFNIVGRTNIQMELQTIPPTPKNRLINGVFFSNDPILTSSDMNGNFAFSNIVWGTYRLNAEDSSGSYCIFTVETNTIGTWHVTSLVTNSAALLPTSWTFDSVTTTFDSQ